MTMSVRFNEKYLPNFGNNWKLFMGWGIALIILGLFAMTAAAFTTLITVVLLGFLFIFSGVIIAADTFTFWTGKWTGFALHLIASILYFYVGFILVTNPVESAAPLTMLLGVFYLILGAFRIGTSTALQFPGWGWSLLNGIISFFLGILIITNWQEASFFIIGLFVGIDLFFCGLTYVMAAMAARALTTGRNR